MNRILKLTLIIVGSVLAWSVAGAVRAATLTVGPSASVEVGDTRAFSVSVTSAEQAMNASQGKLTFPADKLQVVSVSKGSLFSYWTQEPSYSNANGYVLFGGGLPTPGYKGSGKTIITVTFRATATGSARLTFASGVVLANDGEGTNILTGYGTATVTISAKSNLPSSPTPTTSTTPSPVVTSSSHPDQRQWYSKSDVTMLWTKPAGMQAVSYAFDRTATTTPDDDPEANAGTTTFSQTADGTWYFHLRAKYAAGWSSTLHFRVQVDTQAPESFTPTVVQDGGQQNPQVTIRFETVDKGSGGVAFAIALDNGDFTTVTSPYAVPRQRAGLHQFTVRATDAAGNYRDGIGQFTIVGSPAPRLTQVPTRVELFGQIIVEGLSVQGDTVSILIDGNVVGEFAVSDNAIPSSPGAAVPDGLVLWRFVTAPFIPPGRHQLTATATNQYGVDSPPSVPATFQTLGSAVHFLGMLVPTYVVIVGLVVIIFVLCALLILVYEEYRHWRRAESFDLNRAEEEINDEIMKLQATLEKDIVGAIRTAVTERSLQAATHEEIRHDIAQTRARIDALIDKQVKQLKRKRKK